MTGVNLVDPLLKPWGALKAMLLEVSIQGQAGREAGWRAAAWTTAFC